MPRCTRAPSARLAQCDQAQYDQAQYDQAQYDQAQYDQAQYDQAQYDQAQYDQAQYDQAQYDQATGTASVVNHISYDTFGNVTGQMAAVDHLFGYTGRAYDEATGLQNNLHRW